MRIRVGSSPIAVQIRDYRQKTGTTQREVAKLLATSENNVARWERGVIWPDPNWRRRILVLINGGQAMDGTPLAQALIAYRQHHAFTQEEAAQHFGVGLRTWQAWERGERKPNRDRQRWLWRALDGATQPVPTSTAAQP